MKNNVFLRLFAMSLAFFSAVSVFSQTAISSIRPEGLTINASGKYYFTNDIYWKGQAGSLTAITIKAPDVVLDMRGHSLIAPSNVSLSGTIGIVSDGADNFSLSRGTIKGFQLIGVALANSSGISLSRITIKDIGNGVPGYTPYGLSATKCTGLTLNRITVKNVNGSWFAPNSYGQIVNGIFLNGCQEASINGIIDGIYGYSSVVAGIFGISCEGITLKNLNIKNVNGSATVVSGISFGLSTNMIIEKCTVSDLHNDAGVCSGIGFDDCQHIDVLKTNVYRLSTGLTPNENAPGHTCIGMVFAPIRVVEGVSAINVANPGALYSQLMPPTVVIGPPQDPTGTRAVAIPVISSIGELEEVLILNPGSGYSLAPNVTIAPNPFWPLGDGATATSVISAIEEGSANDILVENCKITDIEGSCDDAHGISLFVVSEAIVRKVTVKRVSDGRGGRGAKATGIEIYGLVNAQPSNILVENCNVSDISAISPGDLQAAGYSVAGKGVTFSKCKASNVTVSGANPIDPTAPGYGIGFGWAPDIRTEYTYAALEAQIKDCTASNCQVGFDTFYFQNSTWDNITSKNNDIDIREDPAGAVRVLYCDSASECPSAPENSPDDWYKEIPVTNISSGNTIGKVNVR